MIDVADVVPLAIEVRNASDVLENGGTVTVTITKPDGTSVGPFTVTATSPGVYSYPYTVTAAGLHDVVWTITGANAGSHRDVFVAGPYEPLASMADVIDALGAGYVAADANRLRDVIASASAVIEARRPIRRTTKTLTTSGGSPVIALPWKPVQSISSVTVDGLTVTDYALDPVGSLLWRDSSRSVRWGYGVGNVVVTAVVGYDSPPRLAVEACILQACHQWEQRRGGGTRPGRFGSTGESDFVPGMAHVMTYRVAELLDSLDPANSLPGFG